MNHQMTPWGRILLRGSNPTVLKSKPIKKAVVPMQYEDMTAPEVLEDVRKKLLTRISQEEKALHILQSNIRDLKNTISNIDDFIEDQKQNNRSKLDPSKCLHINKILVADNNKEVVNCADCGLMLSYKVL